MPDERNSMSQTTTMPTDDFRLMLVCAFRYALGRQSYITGCLEGWLKRYWPVLSVHDQRLIHREIVDAIARDCAGMDCDVAGWKKILELPVKGRDYDA